LRALAIAALIMGVRLLVDVAGLERISVSPLVATLITADVFVLAFILNGVISDYKESEKLPGDLAVTMESIAEDCALLWRHKQAEPARGCLRYTLDLTIAFKRWFWRKERTQDLMDKVYRLGDFFMAFEPFTQANFIVRLKQEQSAISRTLVRIDTIRDTTFVSSGQTMAKIITVFVLAGLLTIRIHPWYESVFVVGMIAWFLSYLILLIADLDNPFDYEENGRARGQEIPLKLLDDLEMRIARKIESVESVSVVASESQREAG
jgi:predicted membrane chloride channel (bestrophin family)